MLCVLNETLLRSCKAIVGLGWHLLLLGSSFGLFTFHIPLIGVGPSAAKERGYSRDSEGILESAAFGIHLYCAE
jgi:hypothetical protein